MLAVSVVVVLGVIGVLAVIRPRGHSATHVHLVAAGPSTVPGSRQPSTTTTTLLPPDWTIAPPPTTASTTTTSTTTMPLGQGFQPAVAPTAAPAMGPRSGPPACSPEATVTVSIADPVPVAQVVLAYPGGSVAMQPAGGSSWTATVPTGAYGAVSLTITDADGTTHTQSATLSISC